MSDIDRNKTRLTTKNLYVDNIYTRAPNANKIDLYGGLHINNPFSEVSLSVGNIAHFDNFRGTDATLESGLSVGGNMFVEGYLSISYLVGDGSRITGIPGITPQWISETYGLSYDKGLTLNKTTLTPGTHMDISGNTRISNNLSIGKSLTITGPLVVNSSSIASSITGDVVVTGNLQVTGTQTTIHSNQLNIKDNIVVLADNNGTNTVPMGILGSYSVAGSTNYTGFLYDPTEKQWWGVNNIDYTSPITFNGVEDSSRSTFYIGETNTLDIFNKGFLSISDEVYLDGSMNISGNTFLKKNIRVNDSAIIRKNLSIGETSYINNLDITGKTILDNTLSVSNRTYIDGGLYLNNKQYIKTIYTNDSIPKPNIDPTILYDISSSSSDIFYQPKYAFSDIGLYWQSGYNYDNISGSYNINTSLTSDINGDINYIYGDWIEIVIPYQYRISNIVVVLPYIYSIVTESCPYSFYLLGKSINNNWDMLLETVSYNWDPFNPVFDQAIINSKSYNTYRLIVTVAGLPGVTTFGPKKTIIDTIEFSGHKEEYILDYYSDHSLDVVGLSQFAGDLSINGNVDISGTISISKDIYLDGNQFISGSEYITGILSISDNVYLQSSLDISGNTTIRNNVSINGVVDISGQTTIRNSLTIYNTVNISGQTNIDNVLSITNKTYINGGLYLDNKPYIGTGLIADSIPDPNVGDPTTLYTINASSDNGFDLPKYAYDKTNRYWGSASWYESSDLGMYTGFETTNNIVGGAYSSLNGEWLDITLPYSYKISNLKILLPNNSEIITKFCPYTFYFLAENIDGSWQQLLSVEQYNWNAYNPVFSQAISTNNLYHTFRIVVTRAGLGLSLMGPRNTVIETVEFEGFREDNSVVYFSSQSLDVSGLSKFRGDISISGDIDLSGNEKISNTLSVSKQVYFKDILDVSDNVYFRNNLSINANSYIDGDVFIGGNLNLTGETLTTTTIGDLVVYNTTSIANNTAIRGTLDICGNTTIFNSLNVSGYTTIDNGLSISGKADFRDSLDISGNLTVDGQTKLTNTLNISGYTTIDDGLSVSGKVDFRDSLDVSGSLTVDHETILNSLLNISGFTTIDNGLSVSGKVDFRDNLDVSGNLTVDGQTRLTNSLNVSGYTTIDNGLSVSGKVDFRDNLDISGSLTVDGQTVLTNSLNISGYTTIDNGLSISGKVDMRDSLDVSGNLTVDHETILNSLLNISGYTTIDSGLSVSGKVDMRDSLDVSGNLTVDGQTVITNSLNISGYTTIDNSLSISSDVAIRGNTDISLNLTVDGQTRITNSLNVSGYTTIDDGLSISGKVDFRDSLDVSGNITVDGYTVLTNILNVSGYTTIDNGLSVIGKVDFRDSLDVSGNIIVDGQSRLNNTLNVSGYTTIDNGLSVSGDVDIRGSLDISHNLIVDNNTILNGLLNISGYTTIDNGLSVSGDIDIRGNLDVSFNLTVDGELIVNNTANIIGATYLHNILDVTGSTILGGSATISGQTDILNKLRVYGATDLYDSLYISGYTAIQNSLSISATITGNAIETNSMSLPANTMATSISIDNDITMNNTKIVFGGSNSEIHNLTYIHGKNNSDLTIRAPGNNNSHIYFLTNKEGDPNMGAIVDTDGDLILYNALSINSMTYMNDMLSIGKDVYIQDGLAINIQRQSGYVLDVSGNSKFEGDVHISGNITFDGSSIELNTTSLTVQDNVIAIADGNVDDLIPLGFIAHTKKTGSYPATVTHTGLVKKQNNDGRWWLINQYDDNPGLNTFNPTDSNRDSLVLDHLFGLYIDISGDSIIKGNEYISGSSQIAGNLSVTGNAGIYGTLSINGATSLENTVGISGATKLASTLDISGSTRLQNSISVWGITTLANAVNISGTITMASNVSINGDTGIGGTVSITGATNLVSTLGVNGATRLNRLDISGATALYNTLDVSGSTRIQNSLSIWGITTVANVLNISGATTIASTLSIGGNTTISGKVGIGTTNPQSTLHVVGSLGRAYGPEPISKGIHMGEAGSRDFAVEIVSADSSSSSYIDFTTPGVDFNGRILYTHGSSMKIQSKDPMIFSTGSSLTERMRIDTTGFIGIGNTSPISALDVNGNIVMRGTTLALSYDTSPNIYIQDDGTLANFASIRPLSFLSNGSERMRITTGGNVGIGTTNPGYPLSILSSQGDLELKSTATAYNSGQCNIYFNTSTALNPLARIRAIDIATSPNAYASQLEFYTQYNTSLNRAMTINQFGNVGIGTISPGSKLEVYNPATTNNLQLHLSSEPLAGAGNTSYTSLRITKTNNSVSAYGGEISGYLTQNTGGGLFFSYLNGGNPTEAMRINHLGNVGIGTTNPGVALDVSGSIRAINNSYFLDKTSSDNLSNGFYFRKLKTGGISAASELGYIYFSGNDASSNVRNGALIFAGTDVAWNTSFASGWATPTYLTFNTTAYGNNSVIERMRIDSSGNVGIGKGGPISVNSRLHVKSEAGENVTIEHTRYNGTASLYMLQSSVGAWRQQVAVTNDASGFSAYTIGYAGATSFASNPSITNAKTATYTERFRIDSSGNVGIGTDNPGSLLEVYSTSAPTMYISQNDYTYLPVSDTDIATIRFQNNRQQADKFADIRATVRGGSSYYTPSITFWTKPAYNLPASNTAYERMRITESGNVGIGTTNPSQKLVVYNTTTLLASITNTDTTTTYSGLELKSGTASGYLFLNSNGRTSDGGASALTLRNDSGTLRLQSSGGNTDTTNGMWVVSGNVGVGRTDPNASHKLDVAGVLRVADNSSTTSYLINLGSSGVGTTRSAMIYGDGTNMVISNQENGYMLLGTNNTERVRITNSGNVGIGTTNPGSKLNINTANSTDVGLALGFNTNPGTQGGGLFYGPSIDLYTPDFYGNSYIGARIRAGNKSGGATTNSVLSFFTTSADNNTLAEAITIANSRNVGIGTTNPAYKLDVNGDINYLGYKYLSSSFKTASIYIRGTGLNNNANRQVYLNNTLIVDSNTIGLALTIISNTLTHVSTTVYDTLNNPGTPTAITNLTTALTTLAKDQIGILTSYDAWEGGTFVSSVYASGSSTQDYNTLKKALLLLGLVKLAGVVESNLRRPYAAIFTGYANDNVSLHNVIERMETSNSNSPYATIYCDIASSGSTVSIMGANSTSALYSSSSVQKYPVLHCINDNVNIGNSFLNTNTRLLIAKSHPASTTFSSCYYLGIGGNEFNLNSYRIIGFGWKGYGGSETTHYPAYIGYQERTTTGNTYGDLIFGTRNFTDSDLGANERMRIDYNGNVGIGTNDPKGKLHVNGSIVEKVTAATVSSTTLTIDFSLGTIFTYYWTTNANLTINCINGPAAGSQTVTLYINSVYANTVSPSSTFSWGSYGTPTLTGNYNTDVFSITFVPAFGPVTSTRYYGYAAGYGFPYNA